jgi:hypothetical protein
MADFLSTLFSGGAQEDAAAKNAQALQQYQGTALPALQTGYNTGTTALNSAIGAYTPLANLGQQYTGAGGMLMNSLAGQCDGSIDVPERPRHDCCAKRRH